MYGHTFTEDYYGRWLTFFEMVHLGQAIGLCEIADDPESLIPDAPKKTIEMFFVYYSRKNCSKRMNKK